MPISRPKNAPRTSKRTTILPALDLRKSRAAQLADLRGMARALAEAKRHIETLTDPQERADAADWLGWAEWEMRENRRMVYALPNGE